MAATQGAFDKAAIHQPQTEVQDQGQVAVNATASPLLLQQLPLPTPSPAAIEAAVKAGLTSMLASWVTGTAPQLGAEWDQVAWFLSKRANVKVNNWLASKKFAMLQPVSPTGTGCIMVSREAVEHCRDHRALEGVGHGAVIELLCQLFVAGSPAYAPNTSKGPTGAGYPNQLVMFDSTYTALDQAAMGETPVGILQHEGAPFAHLKLMTAYWTKPGSASQLRAIALKN